MKFLLYPLALVYGMVIAFRNLLYDWRILKSTTFPVPIILAGNISTGGTGKTPCVEHLITLLKDQYKVAVISRGYKRKTCGFLLADEHATWREVGDEPLQIKSRFPDVIVAVDRNRTRGIKTLLQLNDPPQVIIMDDGFQHRKVKPALSILLTDYSKPYKTNHLLPVGTLREQGRNSRRANVVVVTKSPAVHSPITERLVIKSLKPKKYQPVFFSYIQYGKITPIQPEEESCKTLTPNTIIMVSGIANPSVMEQHLQKHCSNLITLSFPDHHQYSPKDYQKIIRRYNDQFTRNKIIVITEKDYHRMKHDPGFETLKKLRLHYLPIKVGYHTNLRNMKYDDHIQDYLTDYFQNKTGHNLS